MASNRIQGAQTRRSSRGRSKVSYTELSSESESDSEGSREASEAYQTRSRTSSRNGPLYGHPVDSILDIEAGPSRPSLALAPNVTQRSSHQSQKQLPTRSSKRKKSASNRNSSKKSRKSTPVTTLGKKLVPRGSDKGKEQLPEVVSKVIPPWQSLPHHIIIPIFYYASYPLYDEAYFQPKPSIDWLLGVSRLCKSFCEPALNVLYSSPPLIPMSMAHHLVDSLQTDPSTTMYNYRRKVKSLQIDFEHVAQYAISRRGIHDFKRGTLDFYALIKRLPRLEVLEFYHRKDKPPYRELDHPIRSRYPTSLFAALDWSNPANGSGSDENCPRTVLRSWRWSSRLASGLWDLPNIKIIHQTPAFSGLRKVAFVNYQDGAKDLTNSLTVLHNLETIIIESSNIVSRDLLEHLPRALKEINFTNCNKLDSDDFEAFLLSHGSNLRSLTLNHNKTLSLAWLSSLGKACPKLEYLIMDLTYYAERRQSHPSALYVNLLTKEDVPDWPFTLRTIDLTQLKHWDSDAAEMFFQSLLDGAKNLVDLRNLNIHAILSIDWRSRAAFRDEWIGRLTRAFKRVSKDPNVHRTIAEYSSSNAQKSPAGKRISLPRGSHGQSSTVESVGGFCEVVSIRIDDERARETRATEADFLDSEPEDDSDWDE